jgi:hypothetical protein
MRTIINRTFTNSVVVECRAKFDHFVYYLRHDAVLYTYGHKRGWNALILFAK